MFFKYVAHLETPSWPSSHSDQTEEDLPPSTPRQSCTVRIRYSRGEGHFWTVETLPVTCSRNDYPVHHCLSLRMIMQWMLARIKVTHKHTEFLHHVRIYCCL